MCQRQAAAGAVKTVPQSSKVLDMHACMHARAHIIIHHSTGRSKVAPEKSTQGGPAFQLGESRVGLNIDRS